MLIVLDACRSGGIQGGLSNGELIVAKIAFKPTSTIARKQNTVSRAGEPVELLARGRHDPCVVPRAVPMVEAMAALVLADQLLQVPLVPIAQSLLWTPPTQVTESEVLARRLLLHCPWWKPWPPSCWPTSCCR